MNAFRRKVTTLKLFLIKQISKPKSLFFILKLFYSKNFLKRKKVENDFFLQKCNI